jgi:hypothetical protein
VSDIEQLKARALAARRFSVVVDGRTYVLQLPTQHELELAAARKAAGEAGMVEFFRAQLERAVVGWSDVTDAVFVGGQSLDYAPVPYSPELVPWLLDAQPADAEQLRAALIEKLAERRARVEAAAKN